VRWNAAREGGGVRTNSVYSHLCNDEGGYLFTKVKACMLSETKEVVACGLRTKWVVFKFENLSS
jgi:hypothetical protein